MAALSSYTPISTQTLTADGQTVTFSSIPATYTDLVLVINATAVSTALDISMRFNSDTSSNYSRTLLMGNGTSATSARESNMTSTQINNISQISSTAAAYTGTVHIFNYANTTTYKTILSRSNNAAFGVEAVAHVWRKTPEAIHTITLTSTATRDMKIGSSFSLYGIANNTAGAKATGGVISSDSSYFYHSFYATDTFTPTQSLTCDYLVVAGGGGGGRYNNYAGGGGGAGGFKTSIGGSPLSVTASAYTITVGAGGAGSGQGAGTISGSNGSNSIFSSITSTGGGGGSADAATGYSGGSGGGGSGSGTAGGSASPAGQGNAGGAGARDTTGSGVLAYAGGGGGAGAAGSAGTSSAGGNGGVGLTSTLNAQSLAVYYAGGGGGASGKDSGRTGIPAGTGGLGGGGNGGSNTGTGIGDNGVVGTGGGGGGNSYPSASGVAGTGGSGVVIIRYAR